MFQVFSNVREKKYLQKSYKSKYHKFPREINDSSREQLFVKIS